MPERDQWQLKHRTKRNTWTISQAVHEANMQDPYIISTGLEPSHMNNGPFSPFTGDEAPFRV